MHLNQTPLAYKVDSDGNVWFSMKYQGMYPDFQTSMVVILPRLEESGDLGAFSLEDRQYAINELL